MSTDRIARSDRPIRLGLTGPIGCGKSTVAGWLGRRGAIVVDADAIAREVTAPGESGHAAVLARFGDAVRAADGTLDRPALARIVFTDPGALRDLESIVHPLVRPRILAAIEAAVDAHAPAVAIEAIKLVEGGLAELCDEVWLVSCADQRARLIGRGMDPDDADRRIAAQAAMWEQTELTFGASLVRVDTTGGLAEAEDRVDRLWAKVVGRANAS
ncbi:MAG TPA: dephospho-CoA kinase [Candidatus Limnocylindrales bacterium]